MTDKNLLYYGDNLDILRRYIKDESVDLVYLDPPFNSNQTYNVLFAEQNGSAAASQIKAFDDTWTYDEQAARAYEEVVQGPEGASKVIRAFRDFLGASNMMAYLANMAVRLIELRRVLKPTGSLYLHCDPTASHYLKILLDAVFGVGNFRTEICWKRSSAHSDAKQGRKQHGRIRDLILFYTKSDRWTWNTQFLPYDETYVSAEYRHISQDGRYYKETDLTAARPGGDTSYSWYVKRRTRGAAEWEPDFLEEFKRPKKGWEYKEVKPYIKRYWAYSKENLIQFWEEGRLIHRETGMPRLVQYAEEMSGVPLQDLWTDIPPVGAKASERLGYPTQKPEALLERIILASSNEGDTVLDPFCGCGTAVAVAQRLNRRWIGIDITHLAVNLIRTRLKDAFGDNAEFEVIGEPVSLPDAEALAKQDSWQFQWWALGLVGARPVEQKKGADRGIDGRLFFHDEGHGKTKQVILSVKAGHTTVQHIRDLRGVLDRERAEIGVLLTMQEPTKPMKAEAASAGFYESKGVGFAGHQYPRLQILSIEDLLQGKGVEYPSFRHSNVTFKKARKAEAPEKRRGKQLKMDEVL
ncbi:MAG: hypothetical protein GHCLOJNM_02129 [bacterium]|nr:hypothetical protein [bacterium]